MEQWREFLTWCQEYAESPLSCYHDWTFQHIKRKSRHGWNLARIKEDIIKHFNTCDLMRHVAVEHLGEDEAQRGDTERDSIRERLNILPAIHDVLVA